MTTGKRPRVVLIHALRDSLVPAWNAFAAGWPEAVTYNLLDDPLSADLAADEALTIAGPNIHSKDLSSWRASIG